MWDFWFTVRSLGLWGFEVRGFWGFGGSGFVLAARGFCLAYRLQGT